MWFLFVFLYKMIVIIVFNINCIIDFIVKLEMVRFMNNFFKVLGNDDVFYRVWIISRFLRVVMKENVKVKM